jgi:hypothetical protein
MAPTASQIQQFDTLRNELAIYIRDLVEEEYRGLSPTLQYKGAKFFADTATTIEIWDEMMQQWDENSQPQ